MDTNQQDLINLLDDVLRTSSGDGQSSLPVPNDDNDAPETPSDPLDSSTSPSTRNDIVPPVTNVNNGDILELATNAVRTATHCFRTHDGLAERNLDVLGDALTDDHDRPLDVVSAIRAVSKFPDEVVALLSYVMGEERSNDLARILNDSEDDVLDDSETKADVVGGSTPYNWCTPEEALAAFSTLSLHRRLRPPEDDELRQRRSSASSRPTQQQQHKKIQLLALCDLFSKIFEKVHACLAVLLEGQDLGSVLEIGRTGRLRSANAVEIRRWTEDFRRRLRNLSCQQCLRIVGRVFQDVVAESRKTNDNV